MNDKKPTLVSASPKVRKLARELGADLHLIKGSQREGRVNEEDIKTFVKESLSGELPKKKKLSTQDYNYSEFGEIDEQPIPRIKKIAEAKIKYKFILLPFFKGHNANIKKTTKNSKPKLLLEL